MTVAVPLPVAYRPSIGRSSLVDDLCVLVGEEATAGADVARHDLDRVVRRLVDRAEAGMHLVVGVAQRPVVGGLAPAVVGVDALRGVLVEPLDGLGETGRIDAAHVGRDRRASRPASASRSRAASVGTGPGWSAGARSACGSGRRRSASTAPPCSSCRGRTSPCPPPCTSWTRSRTAVPPHRRRSCVGAGAPGRASIARTARCGATAATRLRP